MFYSQFFRILWFSKSQFPCIYLDPSSCCQRPATCSQNCELMREAEQFACGQLRRNFHFFLEALKKTSGSLCSQGNCWTRKQNWRKGIGRHTAGIPIFFIWQISRFSLNILSQEHINIRLPHLHLLPATEHNFWSTLIKSCGRYLAEELWTSNCADEKVAEC